MKGLVPILLALTACAQAAIEFYEVTWNTPSQDPVDSMLLSGRLGAGANVWVQDGSISTQVFESYAGSEEARSGAIVIDSAGTAGRQLPLSA